MSPEDYFNSLSPERQQVMRNESLRQFVETGFQCQAIAPQVEQILKTRIAESRALGIKHDVCKLEGLLVRVQETLANG